MIIINGKKIVLYLSITAILLIIANIVMLIAYFTINNPDKFDFIQMVDLDQEANLPTLFSSALFLISASLFFLIYQNEKKTYNKDYRYWLGLAWICIFLAFDESAQIHETIGDFSEKYLSHFAHGIFFYPWLIIYLPLVLIFLFLYVRFLFHLKKEIAFRFIVAAIIYLSGAVFFEMLGAKEADLHGDDTILYCILYTIEESLEMFGVIYLISIQFKLLKDKVMKIVA